MTIDNVPSPQRNGQDVVNIETMYHEGSGVPYKNGVCGEKVSWQMPETERAIGSPCESQSCCAETLLANQPDFSSRSAN